MLFSHDDALILGWLAPMFCPPYGNGSYMGSYGNDFPFSKEDNPSTGTGGYPAGEAGKKAYATDSSGDLCGGAGGQTYGGAGLRNGIFGQGGNGGSYVSSGGGGGFFGGGSSYAKAGGGGGSSYVWDGNADIVEGYMFEATMEIREQEGLEDFNPLLYRGLGVNPLITGSLLYARYDRKDYNFSNGYATIKQVSMGELYRTGIIGAFSAASNFLFPLQYNSLLEIQDLITEEIVEIDETSFLPETNIDFNLGYQIITIPRTGFYNIQVVGAQGGGSSGGDDIYDPLVGGCGGMIQDVFLLPKGLNLYFLIGQRGGQIRAPQRPQGYGGGAATYAGYAGGGQTAVFLKEGDFRSRLIVAGGGGGAGGLGSGNDDNLDLNQKENSTQPQPNEDDEFFSTGKQMYIISDLSIAYVDVNYQCSYDIENDEKIYVDLYVDGVYRGRREELAKPGGGAQRFTFADFDSWLPPNTDPYWATIEAVVTTDCKQFVIPQNGLIITVVTKKRPNESHYDINNIPFLFGIFKDTLRFKNVLKMLFEESTTGDLSDLRYISGNVIYNNLLKLYLREVQKERLTISNSINYSNTLKNKEIIVNKDNLIIKGITTYTNKLKDNQGEKRKKLNIINKGLFNLYSYIKLKFEEKQPEPPVSDLSDLRYITNKIGYNNYEAIFFREVNKEKITLNNSLDYYNTIKERAEELQGGIEDINIQNKMGNINTLKIKEKTIDKIKNVTDSSLSFNSCLKVNIKTVNKEKTTIVNKINSTIIIKEEE